MLLASNVYVFFSTVDDSEGLHSQRKTTKRLTNTHNDCYTVMGKIRELYRIGGHVVDYLLRKLPQGDPGQGQGIVLMLSEFDK